MNHFTDISIVIIAAGQSTRLKRPKQLLATHNGPLLTFICKEAIKAGAKDVSVVLGAHFNKLQPLLKGLPIQILKNPDFLEGMGSSLRKSAQILSKRTTNKPKAVLLLLADQYKIKAEHISSYFLEYTNAPATYLTGNEQISGPPLICGIETFALLSGLKGDEGAKYCWKQWGIQISHFNMPQLLDDINTPKQLIEFSNFFTPES